MRITIRFSAIPLRLAILLVLIVTSLNLRAAAKDTDANSKLSALVGLINQVDDAEFQLDLLKGMHDALEGRRDVQMPDGWRAAYAKLAKSENAEVRDKALALALVFGDKEAQRDLRNRMLDESESTERRRLAIELLVQMQSPGLASDLQRLLDDPATRGAAIIGLAAYDDSKTSKLLFERYDSFSFDEKQLAVQTLASRAVYANALLDAVEREQVQRGDVSAYTARQLASLGNQTINDRLEKLWGKVTQTPEEKKALIASYKKKLQPNKLKNADLSAGRAAFNRQCMSCHTLYGEGGKIGPDITGGNRDNLDYLLENMIAPSAVVARDYRMSTIATDDGRVISGIITHQTTRTVTIQTVKERIVLDRKLIDEMSASSVSMMPEGMVEKMQEKELRDLVAYLSIKRQVPLPE